jgi:hypothetical protein
MEQIPWKTGGTYKVTLSREALELLKRDADREEQAALDYLAQNLWARKDA